ncbi:hypothetical protein [Cupriavidus sp. U2]|uniref:hypothetical protein n=1 Tax=Cupriavidus sp. U2 TaxID=2920269 RepID=UPI00129E448B|nr:hypothetical protein [Cupriavidus sp. U2]
MKYSPLIAITFLFPSAAAMCHGEVITVPGIYRFEPDSQPPAQLKLGEWPYFRVVERFENALPGAPNERFAVVARYGRFGTEVALFPSPKTEDDDNSGDPLCFSYFNSFWVDRNSKTRDPAYDLYLEWDKTAFSVHRPIKERSLFGNRNELACGYGIRHKEVTYFSDHFSLFKYRRYTAILKPSVEVSMFARADRAVSSLRCNTSS